MVAGFLWQLAAGTASVGPFRMSRKHLVFRRQAKKKGKYGSNHNGGITGTYNGIYNQQSTKLVGCHWTCRIYYHILIKLLLHRKTWYTGPRDALFAGTLETYSMPFYTTPHSHYWSQFLGYCNVASGPSSFAKTHSFKYVHNVVAPGFQKPSIIHKFIPTKMLAIEKLLWSRAIVK